MCGADFVLQRGERGGVYVDIPIRYLGNLDTYLVERTIRYRQRGERRGGR